MIVGNTEKIIAGPLPSGADITDASVIVDPVLPTGQNVTPDVTINGAFLQSQFVPDVYGLYTITWSAEYGSNPFSLVNLLFCSHVDILSISEGIRGVQSGSTSAFMYSVGVTAAVQKIYNLLKWKDEDYANLEMPMAVLFDTALAYMVAAFCSDFSPTSNATGEVAKITTNADTVGYFRRYAQSDRTIDQAWEDQAWQLLNSIPLIAEILDGDGDYPVFALSGRRRAVRKSLGIEGNPLYNIYGDEVTLVMYRGYDNVTIQS